MATWPLELPQYPLQEGHCEDVAPRGVVLRTDMDQGPAKTRLRHTAGERQIPCVYHMTDAELDIFAAFLSDEIGWGAAAYTMPHPRTGQPVTARILTPMEPATRYTPGTWLVPLTLEVLP
jgi:hypothetical protein